MSNFLSEEIPVNQNYAEEPDDPDSEFDKASRGSLSSTVYDYRIENGRRYHTYRDGGRPTISNSRRSDGLLLLQHILSRTTT